MKVEPAFVDKKNAAIYCGLSVRSIDAARARGDLPFYLHGRKVLLSLVDLDRYLSRFRVDVTEAEGCEA